MTKNVREYLGDSDWLFGFDIMLQKGHILKRDLILLDEIIFTEDKALDKIGISIYQKYPNVRFLFEMDFSKDDYLTIKQLFSKEYLLQNTSFQDNFFMEYFKNHINHRLPFLILLTGFIRYEYLNSGNHSNFFENFLKHIIGNNKANANNFRQTLIDYFFRWNGNKKLKEKGLYIYETQTSNVSLKLDDAGAHKYLNSFIFHSGGVSEQDLKEYLKIIESLATKDFNFDIGAMQLCEQYQNKKIAIYSKKLIKLLNLLNGDNEISEYIKIFIIQSVSIIINHKQEFDFKLPLYIRNYLLFIGKYGHILEKINIDETDFLYENETIIFNPCFDEVYKSISQISFKINNEIRLVEKEYDIYMENDFDEFKVQISNISDIFTIEILIDNNLFKRCEINFFKNDFILLNSDYDIKNIINKEIYVPKRDEGKCYYVVTQKIYNNLSLAKEKLDNYFIYVLPLDANNPTTNICNENYYLYFSPRILSNIEYKDNENFLYVGELPKFQISPKDKEKFLVRNLFTNNELNFETFYQYSDPIGKFEISINNNIFNIAYINGFEILQWFNWYDNDKIIRIKVISDNIKVNSNENEKKNDYIVHTFKLKEQKNILVFNQINGNHIYLKVLKPEIQMSFLDKRKNETKIKSKNLKYERLNFFKQLKIKLLNYPSSIKFDKIKIGDNEIEVTRSANNYFILINKIKELYRNYKYDLLYVELKNDYYFLGLTHIVFDNLAMQNNKNKKLIKIDKIDFLINNMDNIKYCIRNKPYFIDKIETIEVGGFKEQMVVLKEIRHTQRETIVKKSFNSIKKDGLYVELKDIDYE